MNQPRKMSTLAAAIVVLFHSLDEEDRNDVIDNIGSDNTEGSALSPVVVDQQQNNTPPANVGTVVDLDGEGMPWDPRIHASTKTRTQKGLWTKKKGVDDDTYNTITASLKSTAAAPPAPPAGSLPPPPSPAGASSLPPPPVAQAPEYTELVTLLAQHTNSPDNPTGRLTQEWIATALKHYGVASGMLADAAVNPALCTTIAAGVRQSLGIAA
jgi:hypothetical protein